jgi:DNA-binding response OmpR family regulator
MLNDQHHSSFTPERGTLSILLVDDDVPFVEMLAKELSQELGHETTVAKSGEEAKKLLEHNATRFHLMLLDFDMPDINGLDVLRWMQQRGTTTPVIMLTGAGAEDVAVHAMKLGAYDYVRKEQVDLSHLDVLVRATHERHLFRMAKEMEEERQRETGLTLETTERMREVVTAIAQTLQSAFTTIASNIEQGRSHAANQLTGVQRENVDHLFDRIRRHVSLLESGLGGVLKLYNVVYAHHAGFQEIQQIKQEFFVRVEDLEKQEQTHAKPR